MMGWRWDEQAEQPFYETDATYSWITNWNPFQDRNQAHMLLKRAEALGLERSIACMVLTGKEEPDKINGPFAYDTVLEPLEAFEILLTGPDIITRACVDVWKERGNDHGS